MTSLADILIKQSSIREKKEFFFAKNPVDIRLIFADAKIARFRRENAVDAPERPGEIPGNIDRRALRASANAAARHEGEEPSARGGAPR